MLLEKYIDLGILFERILAEAERGHEVRILGSGISVGKSGIIGGGNFTKVTYEAIESDGSRASKIRLAGRCKGA